MDEFNRGDLAAALKTLDGVIREDKSNADAFILTATIHEQLGDRVSAATYFAGAIDLTPNLKREVAFRSAQHFLAAGDSESALSVMLMLKRHMPDHLDVIHSLCSLYREAGNYVDAEPYAERLAEIGTTFGNFLNAGIVLSGLGRFEAAYEPLLKAYVQQPDERLALSELFWCASNLCDLTLAPQLQAELEKGYALDGKELDIRENAFRSLFWSGDEAYHRLCALRTAGAMLPAVSPVRLSRRANPGRIRVGYVSADFCEHATMSLFAGVLEAHDRATFEIYGICHTPEARREGPMRERFMDSVDHFVDILALDDEKAAELIRSLELDILVDLKGYTQSSRVGIFARRAAVAQVTYLGFPGSVAGAGIDYALTDAIVTPASSEPHYEEKLLRLSPSYQCNDNKREPVMRTGSRAVHGLPDDAIVFSAFHQAPKIRSEIFTAWMAVMRQVPNSVLWLGALPDLARDNLRKAAEKAGVEPSRLVFAPMVPMNEHLRRLCQADIALDSAPCNGHTTTSDALWAAVPVVTLKGTNFAGRVSESLLGSVGLSELVANDITGFVRLAVELAQDGARQSRLRQHLLTARQTAPLFDTEALTRQIEGHFSAIVG